MSGTKKKEPSLGGLEPPTFRLTAERANRLRHRDNCLIAITKSHYIVNDCDLGQIPNKGNPLVNSLKR